MKIGVCVKIVPDTETRIKIGADEKRLALEGVSCIISPYDEFAIEEALQVKERLGQGEVVLISVGDDEAVKILRNGLAMGADRAIQVNDPAINPQEPFDVARVLAQVVQQEGLHWCSSASRASGRTTSRCRRWWPKSCSGRWRRWRRNWSWPATRSPPPARSRAARKSSGRGCRRSSRRRRA